MDEETPDRDWQQLRAHIEGFLGQTLKTDMQRIEYKPRFIVPLLDMSSDHRQDERREMTP